ncbi:hypothetical protein BGZ61DRAFT_203708 [Ilyonectria robusta]|uniref:uncharacterized protein n=1 Tax=Ilyonectria robusta TaxID=1079257 RepID=UPI001E8D3720|nr:uncharacterized protein BGZ61DRAFT_203708 [Ilyonectria robusta]KAH8654682.1 hypothetical protein BGZ61DRAFT_203708 [Ilyonectria robusta]
MSPHNRGCALLQVDCDSSGGVSRRCQTRPGPSVSGEGSRDNESLHGKDFKPFSDDPRDADGHVRASKLRHHSSIRPWKTPRINLPHSRALIVPLLIFRTQTQKKKGMNTAGSVALPEGTADDNDTLFERIIYEFGDSFSASQCDVSNFTRVLIQLFEPHPTNRVIVFRNREGTEGFGCIRVLKREYNGEERHRKVGTVWENVRGKGSYMGVIPAGCRFEAMYVELRLVTKR